MSATPIEDGTRAERVLRDSAFKNAVQRVKDGLHERWERAGTIEEREAAHAQLKGLLAVIKQLEITAERGTLAASRD